LGYIFWLPSSLLNTTEASIKSGKDSTSTLSLVIIHRVRFRKNLQKSTLAFKEGGGGETEETINIIFDGFLSFTLSFIFSLSASTAAT
jgi:hypothetical protein